MRRTTKKLSGPGKDRFLRRLLATEPAVPQDAAERLAKRGAEAISSVRVRRTSWPGVRPCPIVIRDDVPTPAERATTQTAAPDSGAVAEARPQPQTQPQQSPPTAEAPAAPAPAPRPPAEPFDPYTVALVPVMQREGHAGLVARLVEIGAPDKLRQMARSQQIALPPEIRTGPIALDALAEAIAEAVAKRIADRKAAAR